MLQDGYWAQQEVPKLVGAEDDQGHLSDVRLQDLSIRQQDTTEHDLLLLDTWDSA